MSAVLELDGLGVAFGDRTVLSSVSLEVAPTGSHCLVGPVASGKSTLLRTLAWLNASNPTFSMWGRATYRGAPLSETNHPRLAHQNARASIATVGEGLKAALPGRSGLTERQQRKAILELLERYDARDLVAHLRDSTATLPLALQRRAQILRSLATDPALLLVDETTAGLDERGADRVLELLRIVSRERAVVFASHHAGHVRSLAVRSSLLVRGRIRETVEGGSVLDAPVTQYGREFSQSRQGWLNPGSTDVHPPPAVPIPPPRGFRWLAPGRLGGCPRPGILGDLDADLAGLAALGVTRMICLEERTFVPPAKYEEHGMALVQFPIPDMGVPTAEAVTHLCTEIESWLADEETVVFHCRAGCGRTGLMLGCWLVTQGASGAEALERLREINPRWVESEAQEEFLVAYHPGIPNQKVRGN